MAEEVEIILKGKFENGKLLIDTTEKIDGNIKNIGDSSNKTESNVSSLESGLKKLAKVVGVTYLANQFKNLVVGSLKAAGAMEQVDIALTTMLGSAEKADKLQKDLIEFAKKTPFEIEGIFSTTKQLLAYGIAQEDIISTMSTLGNIASGVGVDMQRLALVFGQVRSTGKLLGQDLNQFTQAGVPLLAELAKLLGTTEAEVIKLKESGAISFDLVKQALQNMTAEGGRFYNLMENQSKTFLGTLSNMADGFFQAKTALGNALLPTGKRFVDFMIPALDKLTNLITKNKDAIDKFAQGLLNSLSLISKAFSLAFNTISNFIKGVVVLLKLPLIKETLAATAAVLLYSKGIAALTIAVRIFTSTALGWISVIIAAVTAIGYLSNGIENMPSSLQIMALSAKKWFEQLKFTIFTAVEEILDKLSILSNLPAFGWVDKAKSKFASMKDSIIENVDDIDKAISDIKAADIKTNNPDISIPQAEDTTSTQTVATIAVDPEKEEQSRLKALKEENALLLQEQKDFLLGYGQNQTEADKLLLDNKILSRQQDLLSQGEFATRKQELDQQLLDNEIALDEYKKELATLNNEAELEAIQEQFDLKLEQYQENQALMDETKLMMQQTQDEAELMQLQTKLQRQQLLQQENDNKLVQLKVKLEAAKAKEETKADKFRAFMQSKEMKTAEEGAAAMVKLQNSKHKEIAAVGKAAAIFQITMDTARGAMSAYSALAMIPIVGPVLGAAAAAAVIAYGAEQLSTAKSNSFAVGTPNIPEDQMANVHKGEMIVPATFSDAIRSGDLTLSGKGTLADNIMEPGGTITNININFEGAQFVGQMSDDDIIMIGERLGQLIAEDIIPVLPTNNGY